MASGTGGRDIVAYTNATTQANGRGPRTGPRCFSIVSGERSLERDFGARRVRGIDSPDERTQRPRQTPDIVAGDVEVRRYPQRCSAKRDVDARAS